MMKTFLAALGVAIMISAIILQFGLITPLVIQAPQGRVQFGQAAYLYGYSTADAQFYVTNGISPIVTHPTPNSVTSRTFLQDIRALGGTNTLLAYFDVACSSSGTPYNNRILAVAGEAGFLHTGTPISSTNRQPYCSGNVATSAINWGNAAVRSVVASNIQAVLSNGTLAYSANPDTGSPGNFGGIPDGVYLDDYGAPISNMPNPGPIEYGCVTASTNCSNSTGFERDQDLILQQVYQTASPMGKAVYAGMGGPYHWYLRQSMFGNSSGMLFEQLGFAWRWAGGNDFNSLPYWFGLNTRSNTRPITIPANYHVFLIPSDIQGIGANGWAPADGVEQARRIDLAIGFLLNSFSGSGHSIHLIDAGYGTKPVTNNLYWPNYYRADIGVPTGTLNTTTLPTTGVYPNTWVWTRPFQQGFVALTLRSNGAAFTTPVTIAVPPPPTGASWRNLQTNATFTGSTATLQNGDALILISSAAAPPPPAPQNPAVTFTTPTVTAGLPATFSATATGGTPPYTYLWTVTSNQTGSTPQTSSGASLAYTFAGGYQYTVAVTVTDAAQLTGSASTSFPVSTTGTTTPPPPPPPPPVPVPTGGGINIPFLADALLNPIGAALIAEAVIVAAYLVFFRKKGND